MEVGRTFERRGGGDSDSLSLNGDRDPAEIPSPTAALLRGWSLWLSSGSRITVSSLSLLRWRSLNPDSDRLGGNGLEFESGRFE